MAGTVGGRAVVRVIEPLRGLHADLPVWIEWSVGAPSSIRVTSGRWDYTWLHVFDRGRWVDWIRLDLQGGLQHESNARGRIRGASTSLISGSRSPSGGSAHFRFKRVAEGVRFTSGHERTNPDLRGLIERLRRTRAVLGWSDNVQLAGPRAVGGRLRPGQPATRPDLSHVKLRCCRSSGVPSGSVLHGTWEESAAVQRAE